MENHARVPLKDQTNDLAHVKRQKLAKSVAQEQHQQHQQQGASNNNNGTQKRRALLEGEEFKEWQAIWRRTMRESVIYFYGDDRNNPVYRMEKEKATQGLKALGCRISPFFDSDVTIIISRKPYDSKLEYRAGHVFHSATLNQLKVWSYEKVFRFLRNLGAPSPQLKKASQQKQDLSVLLTQERLHGPIDRDPSARRDDFHYLKNLYFYCFDLRQVYRPVAIREWMAKNGQGEDSAGFPQLYASTNGRCPFQDDPAGDCSTKKKLRRLKFFEENKEFRQKLIKASTIKKKKRSYHDMNDSDSDVDESFYKSSSSSAIESISSEKSQELEIGTSEPSNEVVMADRQKLTHFKREDLGLDPQRDPAMLSRESSAIAPIFRSLNSNSTAATNSNQNAKFFEIQASGMNNQSTAVSQGQDFGNNGLAPSRAEVLTKTFKNLNKKMTGANKTASLKEVIDLKRRREEMKTAKAITNAKKPQAVKSAGYCESCRLKYEDFDQHIVSTKHRSFALNDANFAHIDELIRKIHDTNILHS